VLSATRRGLIFLSVYILFLGHNNPNRA